MKRPTAIESVSPFARMSWQEDRARVGDITFLIQEFGVPHREPPDGGPNCFVLYKARHQLGLYDAFFKSVPEFSPRHIFEVGIWRAGSAVLLTELFAPDKLVAIDLSSRAELSARTLRHLDAWLKIGERAHRTKFYWETDQADAPRLRELARQELAGSVDLVIDDASHLYGPTKCSFEALFPYVRPGGWYILEDWSWSYHPAFHDTWHPWAFEVPLACLVMELLAVAGAHPSLISAMRVGGQVACFQRGSEPLDDAFTIERYAPPQPPGRLQLRRWRAGWHVRHLLGRLVGRPRRTSAIRSGSSPTSAECSRFSGCAARRSTSIRAWAVR